MNPHGPKKPASDESTSDEEEMIVYDVEDEIESNPDYVQENGKTYYGGRIAFNSNETQKITFFFNTMSNLPKLALAPITPKFTPLTHSEVYQAECTLSTSTTDVLHTDQRATPTLQNFDPVHRMALRICSGAFRTSPVRESLC
ncbi:hypothetical protein TNCV_800711 [Trichonephila clavipes]|nr:hypothetical protein TNCV_800711 [Trichonephila clavipes]